MFVRLFVAVADLPCRDYDPSGPVGPTAFWKISDRQPGSRDDRERLSPLRTLIWRFIPADVSDRYN